MSAKIVFLFVALFVVVQYASAVPRLRRDATTAAPDPLANIQNFLKENLQFDKVVDNLKQLGEKIQSGAKDFAETVQQKTSELIKTDVKTEKS